MANFVSLHSESQALLGDFIVTTGECKWFQAILTNKMIWQCDKKLNYD